MVVHILLLSMLMLAINPVTAVSQASTHQVETCCAACCCDAHSQDGTELVQCQGNDQEKDHACDASCDCGCQIHLNAIQFQFNNRQLAEEQEYFHGTYRNEYHFEFLQNHIHPPRIA